MSDQPTDVIGHISPTSRTIPVEAMLTALRGTLHAQLDAGLDAMTTDPDGNPATVLEDLLVRQMAGYGVAVGLECRHPNADGYVPDETAGADPASPILGEHD